MLKKLTDISDLADPSMKYVQADGHDYLVARVNGKIYVTDDVCTHAKCSLSREGFLDEGTVTCGCHGGKFDLATGRILVLPPPEPIRVYKSKIEGNDLFIEID